MKFMLRWVANALAFYLALYLVDSVISPRLRIHAVWVAVILAVLLGALNGSIRPLYRLKARPGRATIVAVLTIVVNTLVLQIFVWAGASLSATSPVWVVATAVFLSILGGMINWLIGFRVKEKPGAGTRERRTAAQAADREPKATRRSG